MKREFFEQLVREALGTLPERAREAMENVAFVIEEEERREKIGEISIKVDEVLLGLYEGIPKIKRGASYFGVLPDKITLFQKSIEELGSGEMEKIKKLVREVVWHEVGHHFGLDEAELHKLESRKKA